MLQYGNLGGKDYRIRIKEFTTPKGEASQKASNWYNDLLGKEMKVEQFQGPLSFGSVKFFVCIYENEFRFLLRDDVEIIGEVCHAKTT